MNKEDMKIMIKSQQGEMDALLMYEKLAKVVKDKKDVNVVGCTAYTDSKRMVLVENFCNVCMNLR